MCTSNFISSTWLTDVFTVRIPNGKDTAPLLDDDFRANGITYFNRIVGFCAFSYQIVLLCQEAILKGEFLTAAALSRK